MDKCKDCKFWIFSKEGSEEMGQTVGICHRYPPTYAIGCNALIPVVYWCGEWKRKKESG